MSRRTVKTALVGAACSTMLVASIAAAAAPASALGIKAFTCDVTTGEQLIGQSSNTTGSKGAWTREETGSDCGSVGAAYSYRLYAGSPLYWSSYTYNSSYAIKAGSNIVVNGGHDFANGIVFVNTQVPFIT